MRAFLHANDPGYDGRLSREAVLAHLRHNYTNYEDILADLRGRRDAGYISVEVTDDVITKVRDELNSRIEEEYHALLRFW